MHRDDFVVTLRHGDNDTTYREYRNSDISDKDSRDYRYREVNIPYGSEYRFAFKNMASVRRRIEISIDGTQVGDWVLGAGQKKAPYEAIIERFADSAHKFKVVHPDHPDVADPGSADNGNVVVKVWREKQPQRNPLLWMETKERPPFFRGGRRRGRSDRGSLRGSSARGSGGGSSKGTSASLSSGSETVYTSHVSQDGFLCSAELSASDVGAAATVEGSYSNQTFGTTSWKGDDGSPLEFEFNIKGKGSVENSYEEETNTSEDTELIRIVLRTARDMGKLQRETKIALDQLGFQIANTKKGGKVLIGHYDGPITVLEQLRGVEDVEELLV